MLCLVELRVSRTAADGFLHFLCSIDGWGDRHHNQKKCKMISVGAIVFNPSILFIFKYFTFFVRAFIDAFLFFESGGEYLSLCLKSCYP